MFRKKNIIGGNYRRLIDEMYQKYNVKVCNPCKQKNIILADDEATCQSMIKQMIERSGDYKVFGFFNGADV